MHLRLELERTRRTLHRRAALLGRREERIVARPEVLGGEPVFVGTRVSVNRVGRLALRGVPIEELRESFPQLTDDDFELARLVVAIGPGAGRPSRRRLRFKRA